MSTTITQPIIRQLPANLVNQIAAGEVIERPASVVKELVENSLDAGSKRIEVHVTGGGSEMIRISDDGCGMSAEQLPLSITSHATSKLPHDDALFSVQTMGFRGEALASIGSVSELTIRSRTKDDNSGNELVVRGGVSMGVSPCGCPIGTVMEVRNLFFNTPVRHRFLKTAQTERGHIVEAFTRLALANPEVHFVLHHNGKELYDLPASPRWHDRIEAFFGGEVADHLIPIDSREDEIRISGYVCDPSVHRGNNRMQYLFLNKRHIRDRSLQHALGEAYRGMMMVGRFPVCFLQLEMPADLVDVNVHPTKMEVRFTDSGRVYGRLLQTLRHEFLRSDVSGRGGHLRRDDGTPIHPLSPTDDSTRHAPSEVSNHSSPKPSSAIEIPLPLESESESRHRRDVVQWARTGQPQSGVQASVSSGVPDFQPFPSGLSTNHASLIGGASESPTTPPVHALDSAWPGEGPSETATPPSVSYLGFQVHNRYLVTQDDKGMVVIDQHALHERVLYERVCEKVLGDDQALESQSLLVPEAVMLTAEERDAALLVRETLEKIGLVIQSAGDGIEITGYPALLPKVPPSDMLQTVLQHLLGAGKQPDARDLLEHLLSTVACKAAIKAGDPLSPEEITSLLEQKDLYLDTHHCPHGRPTALFFSREELDRMFGRMGARQNLSTPS
ncbi:MAG: DNA mismatch repair endonuclease MutL [Planctomycetota bacterium]